MVMGKRIKESGRYGKLYEHYLRLYKLFVEQNVNWETIREIFIPITEYEKRIVDELLTRYANVYLAYLINGIGGKKRIFELVDQTEQKTIIPKLIEYPDVSWTKIFKLKQEYYVEILLSVLDRVEILKQLYHECDEYVKLVLNEVKFIIGFRKRMEEITIALNIGFITLKSEKVYKFLASYAYNKRKLKVDAHIPNAFTMAVAGFLKGLRKFNWLNKNVKPLTYIASWVISHIQNHAKEVIRQIDIFRDNISVDMFVYEDNEKLTYEHKISLDMYQDGNVSDIYDPEKQAENNVFVHQVMTKLKRFLTKDELSELHEYLTNGGNLSTSLKRKLRENETLRNTVLGMIQNTNTSSSSSITIS